MQYIYIYIYIYIYRLFGIAGELANRGSVNGGRLPCVRRGRSCTHLPHYNRFFTAGRGLWSRVGLGAEPGADAVPVTRFDPCAGVRWAGFAGLLLYYSAPTELEWVSSASRPRCKTSRRLSTSTSGRRARVSERGTRTGGIGAPSSPGASCARRFRS